jgi:guanylate kinase
LPGEDVPGEEVIVVLAGPGGVGKGTIAARLVAADPQLWLSRSWTTREQRVGEPDDAYVFVSRADFEARLAAAGFLEHAEFLGNLYGTPTPEAPEDRDVLLEIEVQGARQVKERFPDALFLVVLPPSPEEQERRLRGRGDPEDKVRQRLAKAAEEVDAAAELGAVEVVNDDLDRCVEEILGIIAAARVG